MGRDRDEKKRQRRRLRSKSPERRGRRSRSPRDRERSRRDKDRRRRSRSSSSDLELHPAIQRERARIIDRDLLLSTDKKAVEHALAAEIIKRRERIGKWREEKRKKDDLDKYETEYQKAEMKIEEEFDDDGQPKEKKGWFEDDLKDGVSSSDEDKEKDKSKLERSKFKIEDADDDRKRRNTTKPESDDDIDPLDAYMEEVNAEFKKVTEADTKKFGKVPSANSADESKKSGIVVVDRSTIDIVDRKGEVMEKGVDDILFRNNAFDEVGRMSIETKARRLANTDHSKVYYRPFRKAFYVEVPELKAMTPAEVKAYRETLEGITVSGKSCPKPIKTWAQAGLARSLLTILKAAKYEKPTPIQAQAIPAIMSGRDVIGIAKTGSGKTLAFLLPLFRHMMDQPPLEDMDGPIGLIVTPTRELATQIRGEAMKFLRGINMNCVAVYGGAPITDQIAELKRGAEIIVCSPGRMIDLLAANNGKVTNLRRVTYVVLDEADRMFDAGFEPSIMKIISNVRPDRQTVLFSATFPKTMEALARKILHKPIEIQIGSRSVVCNDVEQHVVVISEAEKFAKLLELLGIYVQYGSVLIFVDKQEHCDDLCLDLMRAGYASAAPLHAGIDQFDRDSTLIDFKLGKITVLVATGVAARGLDVKKLILVVNFDCPNHEEEYVHRVGRTGRAGNKGYAYTFILPKGQDKYAGDLVSALEKSNQEVPAELAALWERCKACAAMEGKTVKQGGGGFGGTHGFKFDENEQELHESKRRMEKLARGGIDHDDDEMFEKEINSVLKSKKRMKKTPGGAGVGRVNEEALAKAKELAMKIQQEKNMGFFEKTANQVTAEQIFQSANTSSVSEAAEAATAGMSARSAAEIIASKLNEKLNYIPDEKAPEETEQSQYRVYEEELEINDFPEPVRRKLCSRETINQVQEDGEVGMQVKGNYYPPGKEPKDASDRKLCILLEATNEVSLARARQHILAVIKEQFSAIAAMGGASALAQTGRYKVL